jgi:hypothetical protein
MIPQVYNITDQYKGDSFGGVDFQVIDAVTKVPIDFTGATMRCQFRKGNAKGAVVKDITTGNGITVTDAVNGEFTIDGFDITFAAGVYFYDIPTVFSNLVITTYIKGTLTVIQDVTIPNE